MKEIRELLDPGMAFDIFKISNVIFVVARPPALEPRAANAASDKINDEQKNDAAGAAPVPWLSFSFSQYDNHKNPERNETIELYFVRAFFASHRRSLHGAH